jgi:hypothetical protein
MILGMSTSVSWVSREYGTSVSPVYIFSLETFLALQSILPERHPTTSFTLTENGFPSQRTVFILPFLVSTILAFIEKECEYEMR